MQRRRLQADFQSLPLIPRFLDVRSTSTNDPKLLRIAAFRWRQKINLCRSPMRNSMGKAKIISPHRQLRERLDGGIISGEPEYTSSSFEGTEVDLVDRVFTYAKKWDIILMVAAAVAAVGSGVVSCIPRERHWPSQRCALWQMSASSSVDRHGI